MNEKYKVIILFAAFAIANVFAFQNCSKSKNNATPVVVSPNPDLTDLNVNNKIVSWSYNYNNGFWSGYELEKLEGLLVNQDYQYSYKRKGCDKKFTVEGDLTTKIYNHLSTMELVDIETYKDNHPDTCHISDGPSTYYVWTNEDGERFVAALEGCFSDSLPNDLSHFIIKNVDSENYVARVENLVNAVEDSLCTDE